MNGNSIMNDVTDKFHAIILIKSDAFNSVAQRDLVKRISKQSLNRIIFTLSYLDYKWNKYINILI